jgi:hypothetical protein
MAEPFTREDCDPADGLTVRYLLADTDADPQNVRWQVGDVQKLSASVARERVGCGFAEFVY